MSALGLGCVKTHWRAIAIEKRFSESAYWFCMVSQADSTSPD
jgi:hypothetical protein